MVGVQVSKKNATEPWTRESRDAVDPRGCSSAADYSGTGIKQIRLIVRDDGDCRTGAIRIGPRRSGSENHYLCAGETVEAGQSQEQQASHRARLSHRASQSRAPSPQPLVPLAPGSQRQLCAFVPQQPLLAFQAASVARQ